MHSLDAIEKIFRRLQKDLKEKHSGEIGYAPPIPLLSFESFDEAFQSL